MGVDAIESRVTPRAPGEGGTGDDGQADRVHGRGDANGDDRYAGDVRDARRSFCAGSPARTG